MIPHEAPIINIPTTPGYQVAENSSAAADAVVDAIQRTRESATYHDISGYTTMAKIVSCAPVTGVYRIAVGRGLLNDYAILLNQSSSNRVYGQRDIPNFLPGTDVLVFIAGDDNDDLLPNIILGSTNIIPLDPEKDHLFNKYAELSARSGVDASLRVDQNEQLLEENGNLLMLEDFSYGRPLDVMPGEWARINSINGGFLLNDFMAFMKASEMSKVETFLFDNSLRVTWEKYYSQNAAYDERVFYDRNGISRIRGLASTLSEGLGALQGTPAFKDKESSPPSSEQSRVWQRHPEQLGMFTNQTIEGSLVDGVYDIQTLPPNKLTYIKDKTIAPGLLSTEKRLDGTYKLKAAKEVSLEKTAYIIAPKEREDTAAMDNSDEQVFERTPWSKDHDPLEDVSIFGKQVLDEYDEHDNTNNAFAGIHSKEEYWELHTDREKVYSDFNEATGASFAPKFELDAMGEDDPHYETPARKATIRPFPDAKGKREDEVEILDVSSAIRQMEDGSITITGGYGEEIRFYKGNIYLTCPGDIIEQPGRDKVTMAPRHLIQKACKGTAELTSNNSVTVSAAGNMQLVAGSAGVVGTMVIENKAPGAIDDTVFDPESAFSNNQPGGGGIAMKSASDIALMSTHNYIGYPGDGYSSSITQINSGNIITNSSTWTSNIESGGVFSLVHQGGSILTLTNSIFEVLSGSCSFGCQSAAFTKAKADLSAVDYKGDEVNVTVNAGPPSLQVKGAAVFGSLSATSGAIDSVSTTSGEVGKQSGLGSPYGSNAFRSVPATVGSASEGAASTQGLFDKFAMSMGGSLENLKKIGAIMPSMNAYSTSGFYLPVSTWQAILEGGGTWKEARITTDSNTSMAFPGKEVWEGGKGLKEYKEGKAADADIASGYVINTASNNNTGV